MKHFAAAPLILLIFAFPFFSQDRGEDVSLPDPVMKVVLRSIIESTIKPPEEPQQIYLLNAGLGADWLPDIRNVEFVLLEKNSGQGREQDMYLWKDLRLEKETYLLDFGKGDPYCSANGVTWSFRVVGSEVKDLKTRGGWGSAC